MGKKYSALDQEKHGVGGIIHGNIRYRKQDKKAKSAEAYAVIFFPKIRGIGKAHVESFGLARSMAKTPQAAIVKFLDDMAPGQKWSEYEAAGHKVRRVKVLDMGDPLTTEEHQDN